MRRAGVAARHYDVVVVGGGMVGATLALALAEADPTLSLALVDAAPSPKWQDDGEVDLRVSAITPASERVFRRLGAWSGMAAMRISPFREMRVWDGRGRGEIHFDSADLVAPCLGHIIENRVVQRALIDRLAAVHPQVERLCPARVEALEPATGRTRLVLEDGGLLHAGLVVGADGGRSRIRELAGIGVRGWSYGQDAVVAVVETAGPHGETAWQCFLPEGPLAFLPLADGRSSIVWSTTAADELVSIDEPRFCERLFEASEGRLGEILAVGRRASFPLRLQQAGHYVEERLALVGDAAHTIHPLAGQGVNLGILDAAALAEVVTDARAAGRNWMSRPTLRRYERWRKGDVVCMMGLMEGFKRLFGPLPSPLVRMRSAGLDLGDRWPAFKRRILAHQLGYGDDLPRLAARAGDLTI